MSSTLVRRHSAEDEAFWQRIVFPEEDRRHFTRKPHDGAYRWFRSPNIIPIEHWQRVKLELKRRPLTAAVSFSPSPSHQR
jgi:hypothetical protein